MFSTAWHRGMRQGVDNKGIPLCSVEGGQPGFHTWEGEVDYQHKPGRAYAAVGCPKQTMESSNKNAILWYTHKLSGMSPQGCYRTRSGPGDEFRRENQTIQ